MTFSWTAERVVPDTNFLVSALLFPDGWGDLALKLILRDGTLLCSKQTLAELVEVFARPKFDLYCSREARMAMLYDIVAAMEEVDVPVVEAICRDPTDDKFLALATSGRARVIISGDKDLLSLNPFRGILILSPRDYLME